MPHSWFISRGLFKENINEKRKILTWTELPTDTIYCITIITVKENPDFKVGYTFVLHVEDNDEKRLRFYGTMRLVNEIIEKRIETQRVYMISLGQERFQKTKLSNNYDSSFEEAGKIIEIIDNETKSKVSQADQFHEAYLYRYTV